MGRLFQEMYDIKPHNLNLQFDTTPILFSNILPTSNISSNYKNG